MTIFRDKMVFSAKFNCRYTKQFISPTRSQVALTLGPPVQIPVTTLMREYWWKREHTQIQIYTEKIQAQVG